MNTNHEMFNMVDPYSITEADLPLVTLSDNLAGFFGWQIRSHTNGQYSHIMVMVEPGKFVTQSWTLHSTPIETYTTDLHRLKFWQPNFTKKQKELFKNYIDAELAKPAWKRRYDILGVIGQKMNIPGINNPFTNYCSEAASEAILAAGWDYGKHPSPIDMNDAFKLDEEKWKLFGYYFKD